MKKLFLAIGIIFMTGLCFAGNSESTNLLTVAGENPTEMTSFVESDAEGLIISGYIIWGKPKKNCRGFGICEIYIVFGWTSNNKGSGDQVVTPVTFENIDGEIVIGIEESAIKDYDILKENLLASKAAAFDEGFTIPADVMKGLGLRANDLSVSRGNYSLTSEKGIVYLHIPQ
ncbi:MAG: hypothetical protein PHR20_07085 [Bacteroidales bacterium]|nr:hypothetical protein [Bacteroidales bacterium]